MRTEYGRAWGESLLEDAKEELLIAFGKNPAAIQHLRENLVLGLVNDEDAEHCVMGTLGKSCGEYGYYGDGFRLIGLGGGWDRAALEAVSGFIGRNGYTAKPEDNEYSAALLKLIDEVLQGVPA